MFSEFNESRNHYASDLHSNNNNFVLIFDVHFLIADYSKYFRKKTTFLHWKPNQSLNTFL